MDGREELPDERRSTAAVVREVFLIHLWSEYQAKCSSYTLLRSANLLAQTAV